MDKVYLSTVTPVYRGEDYLRELVRELAAVRDDLTQRDSPLQLLESIFADDGSVDGSAGVLRALQKEHAWVRVVTLSRNFGQHPATIAGVLHSAGDWIATLDEDLQHHPRDLVSLLLHAVTHGQDVVYACPVLGVHQSWYRDFGSRGFKALVGRLSGNPYVPLFSSFRMMRGSVARAAAAVAGHETYFDIALCWFTSRVGALPLRLQDQRFIDTGISGYHLHSLLRHARRMLASSQVRSLRFGGLLGLIAVTVSAVMLSVAILGKFLWPGTIAVRGWLSLFTVVLFFGGVTTLLIGFVLEHMTMLVLHAQGKPTFFVVDRSKDALLAPLIKEYTAS